MSADEQVVKHRNNCIAKVDCTRWQKIDTTNKYFTDVHGIWFDQYRDRMLSYYTVNGMTYLQPIILNVFATSMPLMKTPQNVPQAEYCQSGPEGIKNEHKTNRRKNPSQASTSYVQIPTLLVGKDGKNIRWSIKGSTNPLGEGEGDKR
jgi:hypothetical protein